MAGGSSEAPRRSKSNHKCCFDRRYRSKKTTHITDSSLRTSTDSCSDDRDSASSRDSYDSSNDFNLPLSKKPRTDHRKRHKRSSNVSPRKTKRFRDGAGRTNINDKQVRSSRRASVDRSSYRPNHGSPSQDSKRARRSSSRTHGRDFDHHMTNGSVRKARRRSSRCEYKKSYRDKRQNGHTSKRHERRRQAEKEKRKASHSGHKKSSLVVSIGAMINRRYEVRKVLGEGSYGQVLSCLDVHTGDIVAVKALKRLSDDKEAASHEVAVLENLARFDRHNISHIIRVLDFFDWHGNSFISFPLMGLSVFHFLEKNGYSPFPVCQVASITQQLCEAVQFMHKHSLCHTDIKPENMLFVDDSYDEVYSSSGRIIRTVRNPSIKVIDFGSAAYADEHHSTVIQTRHYRAPEVVLDLGWSFPADVWSIGCIIFELLTGDCLFMTHDNLEHLAMMERFLGPLPREMIKASKCKRYFYKGELDWDSDSSNGLEVRQRIKPLSDWWFGSRERNVRLAYDLIKEMLVYEPSSRITPLSALEHPFLLSNDQ